MGGPLRTFRVPLRTPFRGLRERAGVLFEGPEGWAELSAFPDYSPARARRWLEAAVEAATTPWPRALRARIPVNVTVPAVEPERAHALVARSGCSTAKVKVGDPRDEERVEAVRDALGPRGRLRIDANGAWELHEAARLIRRFARYELEYVEQPVSSLEDMARLRLLVDVPLAVDEPLRIAPDPRRVDVTEAADVAVLKVAPLGGVRAALEVAEACGLPAVVSSALETSVGMSAGLALAGALPELVFACGLGTVSLLAGDVVAEPLLPVAGEIDVRRPSVDDRLVTRFHADPSDDPALARLVAMAAARVTA